MTRTLAALLLVVAATAVTAADRVQQGQWQTTMTSGSAKPTVTTHCITADEAKFMNSDAATLRKWVEQSTAKNTRGRCAVKSVEVAGNRTVVAIACGKTVVTGTTTYHGDRYESSSSNGTKMVGRRVGACP
jgi:hypothetical protein